MQAQAQLGVCVGAVRLELQGQAIAGDRRIEFAQAHQYAAQVGLGLRIVGLHGQRLAIGVGGGVEPLLRLQTVAQAIPQVGLARRQRQGRAVTLFRLRVLLQILQRGAEVAVRHHQAGLKRQRAAIAVGRFLIAFQPLQGIAQVTEHFGVAGHACQGGVVGGDGAVEVATRLARIAQVKVRHAIVGPQGNGLQVGVFRFRQGAERQQGTAHVAVRFGESRIELQRLLIGLDRLRIFPACLPRIGQVAMGFGVIRGQLDSGLQHVEGVLALRLQDGAEYAPGKIGGGVARNQRPGGRFHFRIPCRLVQLHHVLAFVGRRRGSNRCGDTRA